MDYESKYTVVLRGQEFILTKSQIEFDSPNYFSSCFLGDFHEAETKRLELSRNPDLFKIIIEYLCGYEIVPLNEKAIPSYMTAEAALKNLRADALFYQLNGLVEACDSAIQPRKHRTTRIRSFMVIGYSTSTRMLSDTGPEKVSADMLNIIRDRLKPSDTWNTVVTKDMLDEMGQLQSPRSNTDFEGLRRTSAIEAFARKAVGDYRQHGWKLEGWRGEIIPRQENNHERSQLIIVLEDLRTPSK